MNTLLNFTPRLVIAVMLITLICPNLMANQTAVAVNEPAQSAAQVITGFIVLLLVILLPLMKKRKITVAK
jgi:hypothetical protein